MFGYLDEQTAVEQQRQHERKQHHRKIHWRIYKLNHEKTAQDRGRREMFQVSS